METIKVSILIPTYNVESYLCQCLDSVISQTLREIEIIIINDGSPDRCGEIMDEYAARDQRVKTIHKENGGYGIAINRGLLEAKGEYVGIVEPDDWIEPDMYERLYNQAKRLGADICKTGFYRYDSKLAMDHDYNALEVKRVFCPLRNLPIDRTFTIVDYPGILQIHPSVWSNIYRRTLLESNGIKMDESPNSSYQDIPFMVSTMCRAEAISVIHDPKYHWRLEADQHSSSNAKGARAVTIADQCVRAVVAAKESGLYEELKEELCSQFFHSSIDLFLNIDKRYKQEFRNRLKVLYRPFVEDETFEYKHFKRVERSFIEEYVMRDSDLNRWSIRVFRRWLFQLHLSKRSRKLVICGLTIYDSMRFS